MNFRNLSTRLCTSFTKVSESINGQFHNYTGERCTLLYTLYEQPTTGDIMSLLTKKNLILTLLTDNLKNPHPQVVPSEIIAHKLNMSMKETSQLLKIMHDRGDVISDADGLNALITRKGLSCMNL